MSWDTNACLKSLCSAYSEFAQNLCDQNVQDLQRQIDVLLGVTSHGGSLKGFSPKQIVYTETLSSLVSVINTPGLNNSIYVKSLMALSQLANDMETRTSLQKTYNLGASLASFILQNTSTTNKQLKIQSLSLMQRMTYKNKIFVPNIYTSDLMSFLVKTIHTSTSTEQILGALLVVANMTYHNISIQTFVKSLDEIKLLYKKLFQLLSHSDQMLSITSLSLLTSLVLNEEIGNKVFYGKNLLNIIQLVFNTLITKEDLVSRQYAVDLLVDLMSNSRIADIVANIEMFGTYLYRILCLLHSTDAPSTAKMFELLIAFCKNEKTCRKVLSMFLKQNTVDEDDETQLPDETSLCPVQAVLHWINRGTENEEGFQANSLAMIFMKDMIALSIKEGSTEKLSSHVTPLLNALVSHVQFETDETDEKMLKQKCQKAAYAIELLICLCCDETSIGEVSKQLNMQHVYEIMTRFFNHFSDDLKSLRNPSFACSQELVYLVIRLLELSSKLRHASPAGPVQYASLIQDERMIPFLSHALVSKSKYLVHSSLQVLAEGMKTKDFKTKVVGEVLLTYNQTREDLISLKTRQLEEDAFTCSQPPVAMPTNPLRDITNKNNTRNQNANIAIITEKLKKGLEIKDSKLSDVMEFYEQKLALLTGREHHLEDLLVAKTAALTQSDRLISQYRCRQAQSEAECLKLRSLLQESERSIETETVKLYQFEKTRDELQWKISLLQEEVRKLQLVETDHNQLKIKFQEQDSRLDTVEKSLMVAEEENASLTAMNECLLKNGESLKSKVEFANDRIKSMEEDQIKLNELINEKQQINTELEGRIEVGNEQLASKQKENEACLKQINQLEKQIRSQEKTIKDVKHQLGSLEVVCGQHEQTIKERDDTITSMQEDLEKQTQIAAMIHNLTSGKINVKTFNQSNG